MRSDHKLTQAFLPHLEQGMRTEEKIAALADSLAEKYPKRIKRIDASMSVEKVWAETKKCLDELFDKLSEGK